MSIYPTAHPSSEPTNFTESSDAIWWTYNPDAPLGEGHGIMWMSSEGWVIWRDQSSKNGNRFIKRLPEEDIPDWAKAALKRRMKADI